MKKYHMRKTEREVTGRPDLQGILRSGKYAMIAMCRGNEPYIVTLSYGYDEKRECLYFHCASEGLKLDFLKDNPNVCATVIDDLGYQKGECSHKYFSVVMWGSMTMINDIEEKKSAMDILLNHLEENPGPIKERNLKNDASYNGVTMLKLKIEHLTGKKSS